MRSDSELAGPEEGVLDEMTGRSGVAARGELRERGPELGEQAGAGDFTAGVAEDVDVTHHLSSMSVTPRAGRPSALRPERTGRRSYIMPGEERVYPARVGLSGDEAAQDRWQAAGVEGDLERR